MAEAPPGGCPGACCGTGERVPSNRAYPQGGRGGGGGVRPAAGALALYCLAEVRAASAFAVGHSARRSLRALAVGASINTALQPRPVDRRGRIGVEPRAECQPESRGCSRQESRSRPTDAPRSRFTHKKMPGNSVFPGIVKQGGFTSGRRGIKGIPSFERSAKPFVSKTCS
jgi:hypothetical protein